MLSDILKFLVQSEYDLETITLKAFLLLVILVLIPTVGPPLVKVLPELIKAIAEIFRPSKPPVGPPGDVPPAVPGLGDNGPQSPVSADQLTLANIKSIAAEGQKEGLSFMELLREASRRRTKFEVAPAMPWFSLWSASLAIFAFSLLQAALEVNSTVGVKIAAVGAVALGVAVWAHLFYRLIKELGWYCRQERALEEIAKAISDAEHGKKNAS